MPRLRAVWATAQTLLTVATLGWGAYLLVTTHEVIWASGNMAAAVFFLVTAFLFGRDHPDGRIVGAFGLAVFVITNALLIFALFQSTACPAGSELPRTADGDCYSGLRRLEIASDWTRQQVGLVMGAATAFITIPEALLLLFGHASTRRTEPFPETPPPM